MLARKHFSPQSCSRGRVASDPREATRCDDCVHLQEPKRRRGRGSRGEEESQKEAEEKTGEEMLWESSLCCFHTGFLLSLLPFPVPEERLIPLLSHPTILCFVLISPHGLLNVFLLCGGDRDIFVQKQSVRKGHHQGSKVITRWIRMLNDPPVLRSSVSCPFFFVVFSVTSSIRCPSPPSPQGLSVNLLPSFPLLLLWFSVCLLRWWWLSGWG